MALPKLRSYKQYFFLILLMTAGLVVLLYSQRDRLPDNRVTRAFLTLAEKPQRGLSALDRAVGDFFERLSGAEKIQEENRNLRLDVARLKNENDRLNDEVGKLARMLKLEEVALPKRVPILPANVIGFSADPYTRTIKIDRGTSDGLTANLPVVGRHGLIGVVAEVAERSALVRQTVDRQFAVSAMIRETRLRGYVQGGGRGGECEFHFDDMLQTVQTGQTVITSGIAGNVESVLPKGLTVGKVARLEKDKYGQSYAIVQTATDFDRLEEVAVLLYPQL